MAIPAVLFETSAGDRPADGAAGRRVPVHDLACEGFSLEPALDPPPGATIAIDLPAAGRRIARASGNAGGMRRYRFAEPLPPALLPRIFAAAPRRYADPPEPDVRKWPPAVRIALLLGAAILLWTAVAHLLF